MFANCEQRRIDLLILFCFHYSVWDCWFGRHRSTSGSQGPSAGELIRLLICHVSQHSKHTMPSYPLLLKMPAFPERSELMFIPFS